MATKQLARAFSFMVPILIVAGASSARPVHRSCAAATDTTIEVNVTDLPRAPTCPTGMVPIEGYYCTSAEEACVQWVDAEGRPMPAPERDKRYAARCGEYAKPSTCVGNRVHVSFCIDEYEYPNVAGQRPQSWMSWYGAEAACEAAGKRLCTDSEWTFACEGPAMQPYPYGDGYHRDKRACNFDNNVPRVEDPRTHQLVPVDVFKARAPGDTASIALDAVLVPSGAQDSCTSPFGVHDMVGNIDEWTQDKHLKSGHVFGVRVACRPITDGHGPDFAWYETGARCCSSAPTDTKDSP